MAEESRSLMGRAIVWVLAVALVAVAIGSYIRFFLDLGYTAPEAYPRNPIGIPSPPVAAPVYLAPMSGFSRQNADALAGHYQEKFGLTIHVLEQVPIPEEAFDRNRNQLVAERVLDQIGSLDVVRNDPTAIVIGLTEVDMYIAGKSWSYAYSLRALDRFAIVSTARMDDLGADIERQTHRLQKMVTKNLGILYYGLHANDDPGSVLFRDILGPTDLDRMSEDF